MPEAEREFLASVNGGAKTPENPNGLNGAGTGRTFVRVVNAIAVVGNDVATAAAAVSAAAADISGHVTTTTQTMAAAAALLAQMQESAAGAQAAAATVRALAIRRRTGVTVFAPTSSGGQISISRRDGSTAVIDLT